jgi:hypothetical protein
MIKEKIATAGQNMRKLALSYIDVHISYLQMHVKGEVTRFHIISTSP